MVTDRRGALIAVLVGGVALVGLFDLIPTLLDWFNTGRLERIVGHLGQSGAHLGFDHTRIATRARAGSCRAKSPAKAIRRRASLVLGLTGVLTVSRAGIVVMGIVVAFTLYPL